MTSTRWSRDILTGLDAVLGDSGVAVADVLGVGIGVPGVVEQGPEVRVHGQTVGWDAIPLETLLRAGTDLPLHIDNGATNMGQAELWFGAGRGARHAVVALIGSGVGASIITHGAQLPRRHVERRGVGPHHDRRRRPPLPMRIRRLPRGLRRRGGRARPVSGGRRQPAARMRTRRPRWPR